MPSYTRTLQVNGTRTNIRQQIIQTFLTEEAGTGKGDLATQYRYNVETLANGHNVYLMRPTTLNKGMDFAIHVEGMVFGGRVRERPRHDDILDDLAEKKDANPIEYARARAIIDNVFNCQNVSDVELRVLQFNAGHPIEAMIKVIKWLFIEQDVTYWNYTGRHKFYQCIP